MEAPSPSEPARPGRRGRTAVVTLAVSGGLLLVVSLLLSGVRVDGASMEPTLAAGERVLVYTGPFEPGRGDLLVFRHPHDPRELLVKRVVALPGERVRGEDGRVYVGRYRLAESYTKAGTRTGGFAAEELAPDAFYLLGDNRLESVDSRALGPIPRDLLVGRVLCRLWPPGRLDGPAER